jgi:holo-[acyl-carrier protein] synthase
MILGFGNDLVDIRRIERSLERYGERFAARVFTPEERARAEQAAAPRVRACSYAKRFAAKEACAKALGSGVADGVFLHDMGVVNLPSGQPILQLTGGAAARLAAMTPPGMRARVHLTITDEYPLAQAMVIIEALPDPFEP